MRNDKMQIDWDAIESATSYDQLVFRQAEVLAQLYQARALNEIAQSLYEIVSETTDEMRTKRSVVGSIKWCHLCGMPIPDEIIDPRHPLFGT